VEEVNRLATSIEDMKAGLRSFKKFVPSDLVRMLLTSGEEARLGGEHREITIYFSDIAGFTTLAEVLPAEELVAHLSEYLSAMTEEVMAKGGTVDKFIGDAVMAFWGAPQRSENHAVAGCLAALACQARLRELRQKWSAEGRPEIRARIGLNTGEAVVGNIGSVSRLEYTAIGDPVNLASRLEGLNKVYGTEIMISGSTYKAVAEHVTARLLDRVSVKGKREGSLVYELVGLIHETTDEQRRRVQRHTEAVEHYLARRFDDACRLFDQALAETPDDQAARVLQERCQHYRASPPPADWDGVFRVQTK
jgi:adenylate cyclase